MALNIEGYTPGQGPSVADPELREVTAWIERELGYIAQTLLQMRFLRVEKLYVEPSRPRDGMIVYADGTSWNPGSGEGFYGREAGAWVKF